MSNRKRLKSGAELTPIQDLNIETRVFEQEGEPVGLELTLS